MSAFLRRRSVRILLIVIAALVVIAVAAPLLVPAGKIRDLAVARVRAATGAEVSFGGASVRLLPRLSVAVSDGRVHGTGEALAKATGQPPSPLVSYDVTLDRLELSVAIGPLLRKRVEIGEVRLVRPAVTVVTRAPAPGGATGETGGAGGGAGGGGASGGAGQAGGAPAAALAVAGVSISDGSLRWTEEGTGRSVAVAGWQQDVGAGDMTALASRLQAFAAGRPPMPEPGGATGPARLRLDGRIGTLTLQGFGKVSPLNLSNIEFAAAVTVPPAADRVDFAIDKVAWAHVNLTGNGSIAAAAVPAVASTEPPPGGPPRRLSATFKLDPVELPALLADLLPLAPPVPGPAGAWLASKPVTAGKLAVEGKADLPWPLPPAPLGAAAIALGVRADGSLQGARVTLPLKQGEVDAEAAFGLADGRINVSRLSLKDTAGRLTAGGTFAASLPALPGPLTADLSGDADVAALTSVLALLPPPKGAAPGPGLAAYRFTGKAHFTAKANVTDPPPLNLPLQWKSRLEQKTLRGIDVNVNVSDLTIGGAWLEPPLAIRSAALRSDLQTGTVTLEGVDNPALRGRGTVKILSFVPNPRLDLDLQLALFDADKLTEMVTAGAPGAAGAAGAAKPAGTAPAAPAAKTGATGAASPSLGGSPLVDWLVSAALAATPATAPAVPPGTLIPRNVSATYKAHSDAMVLGKLKYDSVNLAGSLTDRVFDAPTLNAKLGGGTMTGSGKVDYAADPWGKLQFQAKAAEIPVSALTAPYVPALGKIWDGRVGGDVGGGCGLKDQKAVLSSLTLQGMAISTNGVIHGGSLLGGIGQYLGARQDLKEIRFKDFSHHLQVENGRYNVKDLRLTGFDTDWWGDGWIGFDNTINMNLTVKLPAGFRPELGSLSFLADALRGPDGRIALALNLTGPAAKPAIGLNLDAAKGKTQESLKEQVKKGAGSILDKLRRK